jgi:phosphoribosylpyrophosphate synthetase
MSKPQSKLLLIPGTGDSSELAKKIYVILKDTYDMGNSVEVFSTMKPKSVPKGTIKNHTHPFVAGSFPDKETQVDIGRNLLLDQARGKHVAIVKYLFTPRYPDKSVNDHHMEVRGILNVLNNTEILQRTLVAPYLPYLRSHSIEAYAKRGFYQFDSLDLVVDDYHRGGLDSLICIDPHSEKLATACEKYGMTAHMISTFSDSKYINPAKLGLEGEKAIDLLKKLQPFVEHYRTAKEAFFKDIYFVSPDDGAERRIERFLRDCGLDWDHMGYRLKRRDSLTTSTAMFKPFSTMEVRKEGTYIILDDMLSSGGTADDLARELKEKGAGRVELWCSHPLAPEREKVKNLKYIDSIVAIDTVKHDKHEDLKIYYLEA